MVERTDRMLLSRIQSSVLESKLSEPYWNYALNHATNYGKVVPHKKRN